MQTHTHPRPASKWQAGVSTAWRGPTRIRLILDHQLQCHCLNSRRHCRRSLSGRLLVRPRRKFDVRQWVLVTAAAPLTAWFYEACYLRFCAREWSLADLGAHAHLSNNCVTRGSPLYGACAALGEARARLSGAGMSLGEAGVSVGIVGVSLGKACAFMLRQTSVIIADADLCCDPDWPGCATQYTIKRGRSTARPSYSMVDHRVPS
jgi:hypothetical protein